MSDCCMITSMMTLIVITGFYVYCGIDCLIKPFIKDQEEKAKAIDVDKDIELQNYSKESKPLLTPTIYLQPYTT
jgi:hypothetical protein